MSEIIFFSCFLYGSFFRIFPYKKRKAVSAAFLKIIRIKNQPLMSSKETNPSSPDHLRRSLISSSETSSPLAIRFVNYSVLKCRASEIEFRF